MAKFSQLEIILIILIAEMRENTSLPFHVPIIALNIDDDCLFEGTGYDRQMLM
jgi:hypothetical protein